GKLLSVASVVLVMTAISMTASITALPRPRATATQTITPTGTPALLSPLVLRDTLCRLAPGGDILSTIKAGTRPPLLGRGSLADWLIVQDPASERPCWIEAGAMRVDPGYNLTRLPIFTPAVLELPLDLSNAAATPTLSLSLPKLTPSPLCGTIPCTA